MSAKTEIHKRKIGSVIIFDVLGELTDSEVDALKDFMERNIQRGGFRNVILNTQHISAIDELAVRKLLVPLERPHRKAVFFQSPEIKEQFERAYLPEKTVLCQNEKEISSTFGLYLLERDKFIFRGERRRNHRIEVAVSINMEIDVNAHECLSSKALITNLSDGGCYIQYLDLDAALLIRDVRDVRTKPARCSFIMPETGEETRHNVEILRVEVSNRQTGVALKFHP